MPIRAAEHPPKRTPRLVTVLLTFILITGLLVAAMLVTPYVVPIRWRVGRAHISSEWQLLVPRLPEYGAVPQGLSVQSFRVTGFGFAQDQSHIYLRTGNTAWHAGWYYP